jgi:hypothetical protein
MPTKIKIFLYWLRTAIQAQLDSECKWWELSPGLAIAFARMMV